MKKIASIARRQRALFPAAHNAAQLMRSFQSFEGASRQNAGSSIDAGLKGLTAGVKGINRTQLYGPS